MITHDLTAEEFDLVWNAVINEQETQKEIEFIVSQIRSPASLLDLGCGTGRHTIPLLKQGYRVTGLDRGKELLAVLERKLKKENLSARLLCGDIRTMERLGGPFDGIVCLWNAFCEMATTEEEADHIIALLYHSLKKGGKFLLEQNISFDNFNPNNLIFRSSTKQGKRTYEFLFKPIRYKRAVNTTISKEHLVVREGGAIIKDVEFKLTQRWWTKEQLTSLCEKAGFSELKWYGGGFVPYELNPSSLILVATK